jgi:hypothetical protein
MGAETRMYLPPIHGRKNDGNTIHRKNAHGQADTNHADFTSSSPVKCINSILVELLQHNRAGVAQSV